MTRAPRVLLCCEHYPPSVGGVQEVMRQIAERLAADGVDVTVATSPHPGRSPDTVRNGVRVVSFAISGNWAKGMKGPVEEYRSFLSHGSFDAVLIKAAQQWTFDAALKTLPEIGARKFFVPCGFSGLHNRRYAEYFNLMPEWLRLFDGLIFYAHEYQDVEFAKKHGLTKFHFIPNGVDEREFADDNDHGIRERLGIPEDNDLLITVGSLIAAKGHWEVLRAFYAARLQRPTTLVINGNVPGRDWQTQVKRLLKHAVSGRWPLKLESKVRGARQSGKNMIVTDLARADLIDLYKAADLFVFASHVEYSPLVLFESAAAGTSFISTDVGNSREISAWTGAGCALAHAKSPVTVSDLTLAIEMAIKDKSAKNRSSKKNAREAYPADLTWKKISSLYKELLVGDEI